jgi:hypothetical protein
VSSLKSYKPDDPSTNLNGAIVKALAELETALSHAEHPMRFGTLVVFSDGSDRAARVSKEDMDKAIERSKYDIFAIGLGAEMKESELERVGKTGTARADDKQAVVKAFDTIAARIEATTKSYYLLSYCSPARAGKHKLRIEARVKNSDGKSERTGTFESDFDAAGFAHGCDPNQKPNFDLTKGDALAPKDEKPKDEKPKEEKPKEEAKPKGHWNRGDKEPAPKKPAPAATSSPKGDTKPTSEQGGEAFTP